MEGVLDFTNDLVECVNNDTKELIIGTTGRFHEFDTSIIVEEKGEEKGEEGRKTEQLFVLPSFKVKNKGPMTGFQKCQNGLKGRETPPSNSIFEGNDASCPSIKSIYDDLDLLETMYSGADIELESTYKRRRGRKF